MSNKKYEGHTEIEGEQWKRVGDTVLYVSDHGRLKDENGIWAGYRLTSGVIAPFKHDYGVQNITLWKVVYALFVEDDLKIDNAGRIDVSHLKRVKFMDEDRCNLKPSNMIVPKKKPQDINRIILDRSDLEYVIDMNSKYNECLREMRTAFDENLEYIENNEQLNRCKELLFKTTYPYSQE